MLNLSINRLIIELINPNIDFIYLPYIKNEPALKDNNSLKYAIKKYFNNNNSDLDIHIKYFKSKFNFNISLDDKNLKSIYNILTEPDLLFIDYSNITKNNKLLLANSYVKYQNKDLKTIDIIDDIFNLSLCTELIKGRYSFQILISNIEYIDKITIIEHLSKIENWLISNIKFAKYLDYDYDIIINRYIIGKINLIVDNVMIIIESKDSNKPSINDYLRYLLYWAKYNIDHQNNPLKYIHYLNPLNGTLYKWNLSDHINNNLYLKLINYFINLTIK
jgi:hypothetical protein